MPKERMTLGEFKELQDRETRKKRALKRHKYNAKPKTVDGKRFDSTFEAERYLDLCWQLKAGLIKDLECQKEFPLVVNEVNIGKYVADFAYTVVDTGENVVEDAKGVKTAVYRMKKKLVKALHGIDIKESFKK